jgi:transcriptional regulator with XRE-family HTH domain
MTRAKVNWSDRRGTMRQRIADILKAYRKSRGWNQADLAGQLSRVAGRTFSQGFVSEFESGLKPVTVEYLALFVEVLEVPLLRVLEPALPAGQRVLDLVIDDALASGKERLSEADFAKIAAKARAELADVMVEQMETATARFTASTKAGNDPRFVMLLQHLAKLDAADWSYFDGLALGLLGQRRQRTRPDPIAWQPAIDVSAKSAGQLSRRPRTKTSKGGSKKR